MSFFGRIAGAFGRADAYRDAAGWSLGQTVGYAAALIALATAVITVKSHLGLVQGLERSKPWVQAHVPEIRIQDGKVTSPAPQPYIQTGKEFQFVLDTTGQVTALEAPTGLLLTASELVYKKSAVETRRYSLAQVKELLITPAVVEHWLTLAQHWLWVAVAVGVFVGLWIVKLLQVLVWSLFSLLVRAVFKRGIGYRGLVRVGVYALTVPMLLETALFLAGVPASGWLMLAAYLGILAWGVSVQPEQMPVETVH